MSESFPLELEARRLEELRLAAVELRIEAELALGRHAAVVPELEVLCSEFPYREGFRARHMLALYRSGRQAEALRAFQKTRVHLAEELGLDPSPELRELERRILNQDESLLLEAEPRIETLAFLLSDVEHRGLTTEQLGSDIERHRDVVGEAVKAAGGRVVERAGDEVHSVFADAGAAVAAAERIRQRLGRALTDQHVRMAIDVGEVEATDGDYAGPVLNRAGRILAAGHGGQVLLSTEAHAALAATQSGWQAKALGEYRFKGIGSPINVFQLLLDEAPTEFPPLRIDRLPPPAPAEAFGRSVRGYELREEVGSGDFGIVYRAYQPSVGREVAIKVIRAELGNEPSFVRRFEAEARLVAQLEHPHIVSVHDYWRDPDGAYVVTRWLRGGSLGKALERGPWNVQPAMRLLERVGGALSYAHRQGVVHGDLKPANVLLDSDGHAYLSDFAIAAARPQATAPAYVPPETLEGELRTVRSDIYCLGLLTFELLSGRRPPMDGPLPALSDLRSELPGGLDTVIATATAADPEQRHESVDAFVAGVGDALGVQPLGVEAQYTETRNPYKGLRAFEETDAEDFFGRRSLVAELVAALAEHRLVAVVGPSGIGKSSVVKAGLVHALRQGALPRSESWVASELLPGSYPFEELAAALLRVAVERPGDLVEELARDELGMARTVKRILPADTELLLVIDQFEELFTLTSEEEARRRFLDGLTQLVADPRAGVRVVVTLRADFLDHPLRYPEFGELLRAGMVAVTAPSEDELAEAIEGPAAHVGVRVERGLVSQIIADLEDEPGALPLLQYALTELFAARTSDLLTLEAYRATGGVVGALGRRAQELYEQLGRTGQAVARQVFLRLVGVDPQAQDTRRRIRLRELRRLELDPAVVDEILARYGDHRLLTFDREPLTRSPTVEVAHEALLTQWERLRSWVDERREDLLHHRRLVEAVGEWEESGREPDYLPRTGRLGQFEGWAATTDLALTAGEREFLAASRAAADRDARRRARRRRAVLIGFAALAVAASLLAVFASVQRGEAERQARLSDARALAAAAQEAVGDDPELSLLLALEGVEATTSAGEPVIPEAIEALHTGLNADRIALRVPNDAEYAAWSPDGRRLALSSGTAPDVGSAFVTVIEPSTGEGLLKLVRRAGDGPLTGLAYDPTGRWLVTTHEGSVTAIVWDAATGRRLRSLAGESGRMVSPAFTHDGRRLVVSNDDGTVGVWTLANGREADRVTGVKAGTSEARSKGGSGASGIDLSADGRLMATAEPDLPGAVVRRVADGGVMRTLRTPTPLTYAVAFSPDSRSVAVLEALPGAVSIFDVATGSLRDRIPVGASLLSLDWSSDGSLIAVGGNDAVVSLIDAKKGVAVSSLRGHAAPVAAATFSPDGTRLASTGLGKSTLVWDLTPPGLGEVRAYPGLDQVMQLVPAPGGTRIYTSNFAGVVNVLDARAGKVLRTIPGQLVRWPVGIALSGDGQWLATTDAATQVTSVRDTRTFVGESELGPGLHVKAFNGDASQVVVDGSGQGRAYLGPPRVLRAASGRELFRLDGSAPIQAAEWSPDGTLLATATIAPDPACRDVPAPCFAYVYDARSGQRLAAIVIDGVSDVAFSPDGLQLAVSGNCVRILDVKALREGRVVDVATLPNRSGSTNVQTIEFTRDGSELVTGSLNPELVVWDTSTWELKYTIRAPYANPSMALLATGREVASAGLGGSGLVVYTLDVDRLIELARNRLTRSFTTAECVRYLHLDECPPS